MKHPFAYQAPTEEQKARLKTVNEACLNAYDVLMANCPASADRTLAQRKLQEFRMWANASIVLEEGEVVKGAV